LPAPSATRACCASNAARRSPASCGRPLWATAARSNPRPSARRSLPYFGGKSVCGWRTGPTSKSTNRPCAITRRRPVRPTAPANRPPSRSCREWSVVTRPSRSCPKCWRTTPAACWWRATNWPAGLGRSAATRAARGGATCPTGWRPGRRARSSWTARAATVAPSSSAGRPSR
jgi:hypothetical protein